MTELVRVYHPETDEPFDVTKAKGDKLRLDHGWRSQKLDPHAKRHVTQVGKNETPKGDDWRDKEVGGEIVQDDPKPKARVVAPAAGHVKP